jgi:hypothetical protein
MPGGEWFRYQLFERRLISGVVRLGGYDISPAAISNHS